MDVLSLTWRPVLVPPLPVNVGPTSGLANLDWRHALLMVVTDTVEILPAAKKGQPWKRERIRVSWLA